MQRKKQTDIAMRIESPCHLYNILYCVLLVDRWVGVQQEGKNKKILPQSTIAVSNLQRGDVVLV